MARQVPIATVVQRGRVSQYEFLLLLTLLCQYFDEEQVEFSSTDIPTYSDSLATVTLYASPKSLIIECHCRQI